MCINRKERDANQPGAHPAPVNPRAAGPGTLIVGKQARMHPLRIMDATTQHVDLSQAAFRHF